MEQGENRNAWREAMVEMEIQWKYRGDTVEIQWRYGGNAVEPA